VAGPKATAQYNQVEAKKAEGLSVKDAITAVAAENGMTYSSVQTTYYRTAKELQEARTVHIRAGEASSDELLRQAVEALTLLARRAESQEKDLERLRRIERALTDT
jgi:hypothetical protein